MSEDDGNPSGYKPGDFEGLPATDLEDFIEESERRSPSRTISMLHRSMVPKDSVDEFVSIDMTSGPGCNSVFEYSPDDGFRPERLYFDEAIRGVLVKMAVKRPPTFDFTKPGKTVERSSDFTRHLPLSWFAGVGKDGMLGQPLTIFKGLGYGERFMMEFHNSNTHSVRIIGVLAGKHLAYKK